MTATSLSAIHQAFLAHGIGAALEGPWLRVGDRMRVHAECKLMATFEHAVTVQLAVLIESKALGRASPMLDRFAGIGRTPAEAEADAFSKFLRASFHVVAETLTDHRCDSEQVEWEDWTGGGFAWRTCLGPLLSHSSDESGTKAQYEGALNRIRDLFTREIEPGPHWISVFIAFNNSKLTTVEVFLDGEPWERATRSLSNVRWTPTADYESLRHLMIAMPNLKARAAGQPANHGGKSGGWFDGLRGWFANRR